MAAALPPKPRTSDMTFWSRYDPVRAPRGNTDNWAKLRVRANTYSAHHGLDGLGFASEADVASKETNPSARFQLTSGGQVRRLPDPTFNELCTAQLGELPGDLRRLQPSANIRKSWLNNEFHQRALSNFRYWLVEKPSPTKFGKYGIGSFKTVLGVGNAPRT